MTNARTLAFFSLDALGCVIKDYDLNDGNVVIEWQYDPVPKTNESYLFGR